MTIAIVLICLVIGSLAFHLLSPWYFTAIASNWGAIDDTIQLTFWITGAVFVSINIFVAYCLIRYRARPDNKAAYQPENKKLEWWLIGITTIGIGVMLAPGLNIWAKFVNVPADAALVEVLGQQWHWQYRLPGKDGKLGVVNSKYINVNNPFGMNEKDPNGMDDVLVDSQELHLPLNKPVKILLRSIDVLHNFAVPQFRVKMDLVPGLITYIWVTPTRTGTFDLLCNELCGVAHFAMRGKIVVDDSDTYEKWLEQQTTYAQKLQVPLTNIALGKQIYATCATCHGSLAEGKFDNHAPKLAGLGEWYLKRQLNYFKSGIRGANKNDTYGKTMAPMAMILSDEEAIANVSAYIKSLPNNPAAPTLQGTAINGKSIFDSTCASCHGSAGEGIKLMHAPRLKDMSDWYLATQLKNFRLGYRGSHAKDQYGPQMALMANMLRDDKVINDLLAYIATLPSDENK
jgi:cytochrome c oxidase subunit 2